MTLRFYAFYDTKVEQFNTPFPQHNDAVCLRSVKDAIDKNKLEFASDLVLYYVGSFDAGTGEFSGKVEKIVNLSSLLGVSDDGKK